MRHPRDFSVNEAWIVFQLNDAPIRTKQDGDFNMVSLMDAASCYMLGFELFPADEAEVPKPIAEQLIETGRTSSNVSPQKLMVSSDCGGAQFARLAKRLGIKAEFVPDKELSAFISEAREFFQEQFGKPSGRAHSRDRGQRGSE